MNGDRKKFIGFEAPDLMLRDHNGKNATFGQTRGKMILLSFHPLAWTSICSDQMLSLEKNFESFRKLGVVAYGISVDTVPSKRAWAESLGIERTRLLSDFWPHGEYARIMDLFDEEGGTSLRANVLLDENCKIIFFKTYPSSTLPDIQEVNDFIEKGRK